MVVNADLHIDFNSPKECVIDSSVTEMKCAKPDIEVL